MIEPLDIKLFFKMRCGTAGSMIGCGSSISPERIDYVFGFFRSIVSRGIVIQWMPDGIYPKL
jgi:hypothetical protein